MRSAHARYVEILREAEAETSSRYTDLAISLRVTTFEKDEAGELVAQRETDEQLIEVGGRWDRKLKRWAGEAANVVVIRVARGSDQEQPARWLAEWFRRYGRGWRAGPHWEEPFEIPEVGEHPRVKFRRAWTLMLVGGRRGGKSFLAMVGAVMMACLLPGARCFAISPTKERGDELEEVLVATMPRHWYTKRAATNGRPLQYRLRNRSRILLVSGFKPDALKVGRIDYAVYNEGQQMPQDGWRELRGGVADRGGLCVMPCNPPIKQVGAWIETLYAKARARKVKVVPFHLVGKRNPFIEPSSLEDLRAEIDDPIVARKDIDGEMGVPFGNTVFHAWSQVENVRDVPLDYLDVTAEVTRRALGRAFGYVVGMDFQRMPHIVGIVKKVFRAPGVPEDLVWTIDEVIVEDADENDLISMLERTPRWTHGGRANEGYRGWVLPEDRVPLACAVIMDASGFFQGVERTHVNKRTSSELLIARRWGYLYPPEDGRQSNPIISERIKASNALLKADKDRGGRRHAFVAPHCTRTIMTMQRYENDPYGKPSRRSEFAHVADGYSYPDYRLYGVPITAATDQGYTSVKRFDRREMMRGF